MPRLPRLALSLPARRRILPLIASLALTVSCTITLPTGSGAKTGGSQSAGGIHSAGVVATGPPAQASSGGSGSSAVTPANGRTLLAIYLIGSDLEDDIAPRDQKADEAESGTISTAGAGSDDLREILEGYNNLSEAEKANTDVLIAMGGARKAGWKGVKYLDIQTLQADAKDDYFGNDGPFLANDPTADMGDAKTFQTFLEKVQARAAGQGKVYVDLWDHGGSYLGLGPDTNSGKKLSLAEMKEALTATNFKADIIGFDACLMASLEVAMAVKDHFAYMVASEETEPGHGWDYTPILEMMGKVPTATAVDLGKLVVDTFIDSPRHATTNGRTLSIIDLSKVDAVARSVDRLASTFTSALNDVYAGILTAASQSQTYGAHGKGGTEYALDLAHFASSVKMNQPTTATSADSVMAAVTDAVVYTRENGDKPNSKGMSIYSVANLKYYDYQLYKADNAASPGWLRFVDAFMSKGKADTSAPVISDETPAASASTASLHTLADGAREVSMTISDDNGLKDVVEVHTVKTGTAGNTYRIVSTERQDADTQGGRQYSLKRWNGQALHLSDGSGHKVMVPVSFDSLAGNGSVIYTADAIWNGQDVTLFLEWDAATGRVNDQWLVPYNDSDANKDSTIQKEQFALEAGDKLSFYCETVNTDTDVAAYEVSAMTTVTSGISWGMAPLTGEKYYFLVAEDLKGNQQNSSVHTVGN
ncbi:MAG: hypothetical protein H7338_11010 [Candidatus Sericytochromatia bacterium]|nr:hypothetical protein [Candidatus Sericytochromatia bacterium]